MNPKFTLKSKTILFNALAILMVIGAHVLPEYGYTGEVPEWFVPLEPMIIAVLNMILRRFTDRPIRMKGE